VASPTTKRDFVAMDTFGERIRREKIKERPKFEVNKLHAEATPY
jgi:hypothetical protein